MKTPSHRRRRDADDQAALITTFTGRLVDVFNLHEEDIDIEDIVHSLACINRFCGHVAEPVSVAQHSVYVSCLCDGHALQGLLHDASEAYLGDVSRRLKNRPEMAGYREAEGLVQSAIYRRFGCDIETAPAVKRVDMLMARYEATIGYHGKWKPSDSARYPPATQAEMVTIEQLVGPWRAWPWHEAKLVFLQRYSQVA